MPKDLPSPELLRKLLRYDHEAGELFWRARSTDMFSTSRAHSVWNAKYSNKKAFTCINVWGYPHGRIFRSAYYAHRIAWVIYYGYPPVGEVDHINGDKADYRIVNLRDVSRSINKRNVQKRADNTSGYNGVVWHKGGNKWMARITVNGKSKYLGLFENINDAVAARAAAQVGQGFTKRHGT